MTEPKIIGGWLHTPDKNNEKAELHIYSCKLEGECPLLAKGECIHINMFTRCLYGVCENKTSHTKRSAAYWKEKKVFQERVASLPKMPQYTNKPGIYLIGDYYYIPYSFADMCKAVEFYQHSSLFGSGMPFILKDKFGPEQVVILSKFRPQALMGGEIEQYQREGVPIFLFHLKTRFPEMYEAALALDPKIADKTFKGDAVKSLHCKLSDIPFGTSQGYKAKGAKGLVDVVQYHPESMILEGKYDDMFWTLTGIQASKDSSCRLQFVPDPKQISVVVTDPELIQKILLANPSLATVK